MLLINLIPVLRAQWIVGTAVFCAVVSVFMGAVLLIPQQYSASAAVVLDVKAGDPFSLTQTGTDIPSYMATQMDILRSERVALNVIDKLGMGQQPGHIKTWLEQTHGRGSYRAWLADGLLQHITLTTARDSNAITVSYTSTSAALSADVANAFVDAYMDTALELAVEPARAYNRQFDERAKALREALQASRNRLSTFQQENGITANDEHVDVENSKLAELSSQYVVLQALANESASKLSQSQIHADRMQEVLTNQVVGDLSKDLALQEAKLQEISEQLGDRHPKVVELRANVEHLRTRVAAETQKAVGGIGVTNTINEKRLSAARSALEAQRGKVLQLRSQREKLAMLVQDVDNAQHAYDAAYKQLNQTDMESKRSQINISRLKTATPPAFPSQPRTTLLLVLAITLGALLGPMACLLKESLNPVLRGALDVTERLQVSVIGHVPRALLPRRASGLPGVLKPPALSMPNQPDFR